MGIREGRYIWNRSGLCSILGSKIMGDDMNDFYIELITAIVMGYTFCLWQKSYLAGLFMLNAGLLAIRLCGTP